MRPKICKKTVCFYCIKDNFVPSLNYIITFLFVVTKDKSRSMMSQFDKIITFGRTSW